MAFSGSFVKPFRPAFDAGLAAAAVPWWLAGGAPMPIAVYQPKGAADLAASYVNLVQPGTYNAAPGVAPIFDAATGWQGTGTQFLLTGITGVSGMSWLIRFSNVAVDGALFGGGSTNTHVMAYPRYSDGKRYYDNGGEIGYSGALTSGVMAAAGNQAYKDGIAESGTIPPWSGTGTTLLIGGVYLGANYPHTGYTIQAFAIWNTSIDHATWMPVVSAAAALI